MGAHTQLLHHRHVGNVWRQYFAGVGVLILGGLGLYLAISRWLHGEIAQGLVLLGWVTGPATTYAFGYFWCLPDVLGGTVHEGGRSLRQRWSDFALLSTFIALILIEAAYARAIWVNRSYVELARALGILLACSWLLPACVVATGKYLGWTMSSAEVPHSSGWRTRVRSAMRTLGDWPVRLLGIRGALCIGGALALLSAALIVHGEIFGPEETGWQIIIAHGSWPLTESVDAQTFVDSLLQFHRTAYVLGLAVAILALVSLALGRRGRVIRGSPILAAIAAVISLLEVTHIASATVLEASLLPVGLWMLMWIVPVVVWIAGAHRVPEGWDHTRVAVMVFCLPIFFVGVANLVFFTYFGVGCGSFIGGMLLLWWGLVQSRSEIPKLHDSHAS